ncbi:MAG: ribose 5-phosphate isomerase B [Acidaminococcales bacterium]|nr:ribose 5-phosphate isomerase B [Acidaminococcales bacterium]
MKIVLSCDHGGYKLKESVKGLLSEAGMDFEDYGVFDEKPADYPEIAARVCAAIKDGRFARGILICGTGVGMSIAANRFSGIRAALCGDEFSARMSREHNDANVLCLGGRTIGPGLALLITRSWLETEFTGGRHTRRLAMIDKT